MSRFIRQSHRWISMVFTLTVVANFVCMGLLGTPPAAVTYALFLLLFSGLYLFVLPYTTKSRSSAVST